MRKYASAFQLAVAACFLAATRVVKFAGLLLAGEPRLVAAEIRSYADFFAGKLAEHDRARAATQEQVP